MGLHFRNLVSILVLGIISLENLARSESSCDDAAKLQYEAGKSYVYKVDMTSTARAYTYAEDATIEPAGGKVSTKGKAVLTALENCEYVLTLDKFQPNMNTHGFQGGMGGSRSLPRSSVKFTFKNGEVTNLLMEKSAQPWSTNVLRALLTMIQNKAFTNADGDQEEREVGLRGDCLSINRIPKEGVYYKRIDDSQCTDPSFSSGIAEGVPYYTPLYASAWGFSLLPNIVRCTQTVENGILNRVNCTEDSNGGPRGFGSSSESEATIELEQSGKDPNEVSGVSTDEINKLTVPTTIVYDPKRNVPDESWEQSIQSSITELITAMHDNVENKAELYLRLKENMKFINDFAKLEADLVQGQEDPIRTQFQKNIVRDICTEIGTEAAVVHLANLIDQNQLDEPTTLSFYMKLPMSHEATAKGLGALYNNVDNVWNKFQNSGTFSSLVAFDEKKRIRRILLGVSGYAHQYCRFTNPDCGSVVEYTKVVNGIAQFTSSKQPEIFSATLLALGNVFQLTQDAVDKVKTVLTSSEFLQVTKRITGFEAFRRNPCQPDLKGVTRQMLADPSVSMELRIEGYLAATRCLQEEDLKVIDAILQESESPLSSFIASHVYNIMDSQSPSKDYLKESPLSQIGIPEHVRTVHNQSMSSKYVEYSSFKPVSNLGFSLDGHVAFQQGNADFRFARLNVTIDAGGRSYNVFEIGTSRRLFPTTDITKFVFRKHSHKHILQTLALAAFSVDSYLRVFGTTVTMGIDIVDAFAAHKFVEQHKDPETGMARMELSRPFNLLEKSITFPTLGGLPMTISANALYFPILNVNHTGDPGGVRLMDLISKWDEKSGIFNHASTSDSGLILKTETSIGKGTPIYFGETLEAQLHFNHSIGFESKKNMSVSWVKNINFPNNVIWSKRITGDYSFFADFDGKRLDKWSINTDAVEESQPTQFFQFEAAGLRFSGRKLRQLKTDYIGPPGGDFMIMLEKTEEGFTGYGLDVKLVGEENRITYDAKLKTIGLSTGESVNVYVDLRNLYVTDGDLPFEITARGDVFVNGQLSQLKFSYISIAHPKPESNNEYQTAAQCPGILGGVTLGQMCRKSYDVKLMGTMEGQTYELVDVSMASKPAEGDINVRIGPKGQLATLKTRITYSLPHVNEVQTSNGQLDGYTVNVDLNHDSQAHGKIRISSDFNCGAGDVSSNTTVVINDSKYQLKQAIPRSRYVNTIPKRIFEENVYKAEFTDNHGKKTHLVAAAHHERIFKDEQYEALSSRKMNASVRVTSSKVPTPFIVEVGKYSEYYKEDWGMAKFGIYGYVNAFTSKVAEFKHEDNYTRTKDLSKYCAGGVYYYQNPGDEQWYTGCETRVGVTEIRIPNELEYKSAFSNADGETKFQAGGFHTRTQVGANLTTDIIYDNDIIRKHTHLELEFRKPETKWTTDSNTTVDLNQRTLAISSTTTQQTEQAQTWTTSINGTLAKEPFNGESTLDLGHHGPEDTLTIDLRNDAQSGIKIFNNTLSALVDWHGRARIASPKKRFVWFYSADNNIPAEYQALYDIYLAMMNDIKLEVLESQPREIFHVTDRCHMGKAIGQEKWDGSGKTSVTVEGKETCAYDFTGDFSMTQQTIDIVDPQTNFTEKAHIYPKTNLNFKFNGWLHQEIPEEGNRNHTLVESYSLEVWSNKFTLEDQCNLQYNKIDTDSGEILSSIKMTSDRNITFHRLLDFSDQQHSKLEIDNRTINTVSDIQVRGPYVKILIDSNDDRCADKFVVDFAGGIYEQKHQHKFNAISRDRLRNGNANDGVPITVFNVTVSRRR